MQRPTSLRPRLWEANTQHLASAAEVIQQKDIISQYHQSGCFSLPKEEPLSTCFPQLPVFHVTPGDVLHIRSSRRTISFLVGLEVYYVHRVFCDSDCPTVVTSPRHVTCLSVFTFSYFPDNVCHITVSGSSFYSFCS